MKKIILVLVFLATNNVQAKLNQVKTEWTCKERVGEPWYTVGIAYINGQLNAYLTYDDPDHKRTTDLIAKVPVSESNLNNQTDTHKKTQFINKDGLLELTITENRYTGERLADLDSKFGVDNHPIKLKGLICFKKTWVTYNTAN